MEQGRWVQKQSHQRYPRTQMAVYGQTLLQVDRKAARASARSASTAGVTKVRGGVRVV